LGWLLDAGAAGGADRVCVSHNRPLNDPHRPGDGRP